MGPGALGFIAVNLAPHGDVTFSVNCQPSPPGQDWLLEREATTPRCPWSGRGSGSHGTGQPGAESSWTCQTDLSGQPGPGSPLLPPTPFCHVSHVPLLSISPSSSLDPLLLSLLPFSPPHPFLAAAGLSSHLLGAARTGTPGKSSKDPRAEQSPGGRLRKGPPPSWRGPAAPARRARAARPEPGVRGEGPPRQDRGAAPG